MFNLPSIVGGNQYGSVVYTVPDTLMKRNVSDEAYSDNDEAEEVTAQDKLEAAERLLASQIVFEHDKI